MTLDLDPQEVQSIINVLGDLPTKTNAFPLLMKIIEQVKSQQEQSNAK